MYKYIYILFYNNLLTQATRGMNPQESVADEKEQSINTVLFVMQIVNLAFTTLFLVFFVYRLVKLQHFARTEQHMEHFPKSKFILAFLYIVIGISILIIGIVMGGETGLEIILEGGGGQCINSFILCVQIAVLWQQLLKQQPYTRVHQIYAFYLVFISMARSVFGIIAYTKNQDTFHLIELILPLCLMVVTILSAILWMKKRNQLPSFSYSTLDVLEKLPKINSHKSYDFFPHPRPYELLIPSVTVQKGRFRIILEIVSDGSVLKEIDETGTHFPHNSFPKQFQIVSNHLYSFQQVKEIYIICHISNMNNVLFFNGEPNIGDFYQRLQAFLEEYFELLENYTQEALELFHLPVQIIERYRKYFKNRASLQFKSNKNNPSIGIHCNSTFISTMIFKQLWLQDHYIFYLEVRAMDSNDSIITYKRYSDFQKFAHELQKRIEQTHERQFILPSLPKKHLFSWTNQEKQINQRRKSLESYCQEIGNDYILMSQVPRAAQLILSFLGLRKTFAITPIEHSHKQFYKNIKLYKGRIIKKLIDEDYVTFYQFKLFRNKVYEFTVSKRYSDFQQMHKVIQRWMHNTQTFYQFLEMPKKVFYGSEDSRHEKMKNYLDHLINIHEIYKVYTVNCFFNVFGSKAESDSSNQQYLSLIKGSEMSESQPSLMKKKESLFSNDSGANNSHQPGDSSESILSQIEKGRLSKLIENLGED